MRSATDQVSARVFRGPEEVGVLERTADGSIFRYNSQLTAKPGGIAFRLPYAEREFETRGTNLHPFFANLLPEGLRFTALVRKVKTSPDDLLSLLIAVGADTTGDISVGTAEGPEGVELDNLNTIDFEQLRRGMLQGVVSDEGLPGVQLKISADRVLSVIRGSKRGRSYLLKLADPERPRLVQNEHACMALAKACRLPAAETRIVTDARGVSGLLVERFDRLNGGSRKVHFEDLCQLLNRYPWDKYLISVEEALTAIREATTAPSPSCLQFLQLYAFSYIIGNGDMHAKNFGVLGKPDGGFVGPAPAYDLLTTLPYRDLDQKRAMPFEGKRGDLHRPDLLRMAKLAEIPQRAVESMLDLLSARLVKELDRLDAMGFTPSHTGAIKREIRRRARRLERD